MGQRPELDGRRIDERVGPREFELVQAFPKGEVAGFLDEREVHRIVNGELHRVALWQSHHVYPRQGRGDAQTDDQQT